MKVRTVLMISEAPGQDILVTPLISYGSEDHRYNQGDGSLFGDPLMHTFACGKATLFTELVPICALALNTFPAEVCPPVDSWIPLLMAVELGYLDFATALLKYGTRSPVL